jgi:hypothetical protein
MARLTDTQLIILSAASQRDDRGVELPTNGKGEAARKAVHKLIRAGLLEQIRASGSLPVWRRDDDSGPMALRITKQGLEAIDVEDEPVKATAPFERYLKKLGMIAHGPENVFYCGWGNLRRGGAVAPGADLYGCPPVPFPRSSAATTTSACCSASLFSNRSN